MVDYNSMTYSEGRALLKQALTMPTMDDVKAMGNKAWGAVSGAAGQAGDWVKGKYNQAAGTPTGQAAGDVLSNRWVQNPLIGAGIGGALGLGSSLFQAEGERSPVSRTLTGALLGGLGGAGWNLGQDIYNANSDKVVKDVAQDKLTDEGALRAAAGAPPAKGHQGQGVMPPGGQVAREMMVTDSVIGSDGKPHTIIKEPTLGDNLVNAGKYAVKEPLVQGGRSARRLAEDVVKGRQAPTSEIASDVATVGGVGLGLNTALRPKSKLNPFQYARKQTNFTPYQKIYGSNPTATPSDIAFRGSQAVRDRAEQKLEAAMKAVQRAEPTWTSDKVLAHIMNKQNLGKNIGHATYGAAMSEFSPYMDMVRNAGRSRRPYVPGMGTRLGGVGLAAAVPLIKRLMNSYGGVPMTDDAEEAEEMQAAQQNAK